MKKRIGILTAGGDCPGLNAVIRAAAKSAFENNYEVIGFKDGYRGLIENDYIALNNHMVSGILTMGGTILGTSNTSNPYHFAYKDKKSTTRFKDVSKKAFLNYKKHDLHALIVIGGDGSMTIANKLFQDGMPIVGIPKTIDNDLPSTDLTFGFETAVITATEAIDKIHTTAQSHHRAMLVEVMGRYAGWIALYSGIAGGGDIILIPEIPYHIKYICEKIKRRKEEGKNFTIIVVAEGAKPYGGKVTVSKYIKKSTDPIRLGGVGIKIADEIERCAGTESRATVLGHIQRGGVPTPFDRVLATSFGTEAVNMLLKGESGIMVVYKNNSISTVTLAEATRGIKHVPKDHPLILSARSVGTSFGDEIKLRAKI